MVTITVKLKGALRHDAEAGVHVSYCPALKLYSQGGTAKQAQEALESAVSLFLTTCLDRGILDRTLKDLGLTKTVQTGVSSPRELAEEYIRIEKAKFDGAFDLDIPIHLLVAEAQKIEQLSCLQH